jgi:integrase
LGDLSLIALSPSKVRQWNADLAKGHLSTAAKAYRLLSTIMKTAVTDGVIVSSPCRVVGASTEHAEERPLATVSDIHALTDAMPDHRKAVVPLAVWCQLRRGEILGLRRSDIDFNKSVIHIERSRTFARNGTSIIKTPKTRSGRRVIAVPEMVIEDLVQHLDHFVSPDDDSFLFTSSSGSLITATSLQRAWSKARLWAGRPDLHLHDLRHTGLTLAAATGATTAELMHRAGHASPDAALRYQHATRDRDQVIAKALNRLSSEEGALRGNLGERGEVTASLEYRGAEFRRPRTVPT